MAYLANISSFLTETILGLLLYVVLIRFWMQWVKADFRNQIGQFVITITNPIIIPLRKVVPSVGYVDTATVVLALIIAFCKFYLLFNIRAYSPSLLSLASIALGEVIQCSIYIFIGSIFIQIIASWLSPHGYNPIVSVSRDIAEPIMAPARKIIPPIAGIDLSPILVLLFLRFTIVLIVVPLQSF